MDAIGAGLSLATEVFKFLNNHESMKYIDRSVRLRLEIAEEEAKGYSADDPKLEALYKEAQIILDAAAQQLKLTQNQTKAP